MPPCSSPLPRMTRTGSTGELFAPQGCPSCPAYTSSPCSLEPADASAPTLAKTLSGVFSSEAVVIYDGLELSPLTSTAEESLQQETQLRAQKNALDRSMSHELDQQSEWRGTSNVRVPGTSPPAARRGSYGLGSRSTNDVVGPGGIHYTISSHQSPRCSNPPERSPLTRVNKDPHRHSRGWITEEAQDLPCLPRAGESDGALLGRQTMKLEISNLWGSCSIDEDELPVHMPVSEEQLRCAPPLSPAAAAIRAAEEAASARAAWQRRLATANNKQQAPLFRTPEQPPRLQPRPAQSDDAAATDEERSPQPAMERPAAKAAAPSVSRSGRVRKVNSQFADYVDPEEASPGYQRGDHGDGIWDRAFSAGRRMLETTKRARMGVGSRASGPTFGKDRKRQKKRRVVVRDPNKPKPKPWSEDELALFRHLLDSEGPNGWAAKAVRLGTNRTAKSLHTRWLRDEGRIVDKPRGMAAMREAEMNR